MAFSGTYLVTVSNDRNMRIWAPTPGRQILLFPWFETLQIIRNPEGPETYFSSVDIRVGDTTHIYAGDSSGNLHVLELASHGSYSPNSGAGGNTAGGKTASSFRQGRSSASSSGSGSALFKLNRRWRKGQSPPHSLGITHVKVVPTQKLLDHPFLRLLTTGL